MPKSGIVFALLAMLACAGIAHAQDELGARMSMDRIADVQTGSYSAGEQIRFSLDHYVARYLLRFSPMVLRHTREIVAGFRKVFRISRRLFATPRGADMEVRHMPGFDQLPESISRLESLELP